MLLSSTPGTGVVKASNVDVSIIIVSWNVEADLRECISSIEMSGGAATKLEIIVVDNASPDGTLFMLREEFPWVRVVANARNEGFSAANNQGIMMARGRYLLVLNPDTLVRIGTLDSCLAFMDAHPDVGVVGCKILYPDGQIQPECARNFPSLLDSVFEAFYLHMLFPNSRLFARELMTYWDHDDSRDVACIVGAFMFFRRTVLDEVGVFDTVVPMYLDDMDICYRISRTHWRIHYLASCEIVHKGGRSEARSGRDRGPANASARFVFFLKHRGRLAAMIFRIITVVRALFRLGVAILVLPVRRLRISEGLPLSTLRVTRPLALLHWSVTYRSPDLSAGDEEG